MSNLLSAKGVTKCYKSGARILEVLKGVNIDIKKGEAAAIIGASGAGKSTLLHILGALDRPDAGKISLEGVEYLSMNSENLADLRNKKIGFIYQFHHLLPEFTALENVMIPGMIRMNGSGMNILSHLWSLLHPTFKSAAFKEIRQRAEQILKEVGLEERSAHRPAKLSGGEQQRVALARALINNPELVLADEPTGNLDLSTGDKVFDVIMERTVQSGKTLILVTHNPDLAARVGMIYHLKNGALCKS
ncbi:ABC transporter ATP-binding protein [Candidatus Sumerlaeota bacterium]|nr:ABC transporter ATP-binding protein [Candidatus Sumerlaeota bacterium]